MKGKVTSKFQALPIKSWFKLQVKTNISHVKSLDFRYFSTFSHIPFLLTWEAMYHAAADGYRRMGATVQLIVEPQTISDVRKPQPVLSHISTLLYKIRIIGRSQVVCREKGKCTGGQFGENQLWLQGQIR